MADNLMASAALHSVIATEHLVRCMSDCLQPSSATLGSLCLVSKSWNRAFSPFLYSHILFHNGNSHILRDPELLHIFISNPRLVHVKGISFIVGPDNYPGKTEAAEVFWLVDVPDYSRYHRPRDRWARVYNGSLQKVVLRTPNIYHFEWEKWPISQSLVGTLEHSCPSLRDVCIEYPDEESSSPDADELRSKLKVLPAKPEFQNLRKLYLYKITGDLESWIPKIATMLGKSRFLEELGLSLSPECGRKYAQSADSRTVPNFFTSIIERYRDQSDDPLKLRVLELGFGVVLDTTHGVRARGVLEQAGYLSRLIDRVSLEELYIDNKLNFGRHFTFRQFAGQVASPTQSRSFLPNLRRLTFTTLSRSSLQWLINHPDPSLARIAMDIDSELLKGTPSELILGLGMEKGCWHLAPRSWGGYCGRKEAVPEELYEDWLEEMYEDWSDELSED